MKDGFILPLEESLKNSALGLISWLQYAKNPEN